MKNFWLNKKVLITGHTGFKGSWLSLLLSAKGASLYGISRDNRTKQKNSLFNLANINRLIKSYKGDITDFNKMYAIFKKIKPDICFHLAAQPLVVKSYEDPLGTFTTNAMGVCNILESARLVKSLKSVMIVTTDKVYKNLNTYYPYTEESQLGGRDPYSASKTAAEIITSSYAKSFFTNKISLSTVRAGNVIGGGDWADKRVIPDAVKAWEKNKILIVRNPSHIRPWQHVLDPLHGYLKVIEKNYTKKNFYQSFNFGPEISQTATVRKLIMESKRHFKGKNKVKFLKKTKKINSEEDKIYLEILKSKNELSFSPKWNLNQSIRKTFEWYDKFNQGASASELCNLDIKEYGVN